MSISTTNSSPIRDSSYLEAAEDHQKTRAQNLYRPMSSPIKLDLAKESNSVRFQARAKCKEKREERRQKRLELSREKVSEFEGVAEEQQRLLREATTVEVDLELLLDEEKAIAEQQLQDEEEQEYLEELEMILAQEQAELELHLENLAL